MKNSLSRDRIVALLLALQPYRGFRFTAIDATIAAKDELKELLRLGYLALDPDKRFHFTTLAYHILRGN